MALSIPSQSITLFRSNTAQPGWTKLTGYNDHTLRITNGATSVGGTVNFSTVFTSVPVTGTATVSGTVSNVTLTIAQMGSHSHPASRIYGGGTTPSPTATWGAPSSSPNVEVARYPVTTVPQSTTTVGGGGAHSHPFTNSPLAFTGGTINFNVRYVDVIVAQRN